VLLGEDAVEERGFAGAEEAGEDGDRNGHEKKKKLSLAKGSRRATPERDQALFLEVEFYFLELGALDLDAEDTGEIGAGF